MRSLFFVVILALVIPVTASAQPSSRELAPRATPGRDEPHAATKSPRVAATLSISATLLGVGLIVTAAEVHHDEAPSSALAWTGVGLAVIGPATGHIYASEYRHALTTTAVRGGGIALATLGAVDLLTVCDHCDARDHTLGTMALIGGLGLYAGATIYDLVDAPRAARRASTRPRPMIVPTALSTAHGPAPGLVVMGSF